MGRLAKSLRGTFLPPYVSIWVIESNKSPGKVEWWAISGDMQNDYVSGSTAGTPREAMHAIASLWKEKAQYIARGERHPTFVIGTGENDGELASMLSSRAQMLLEWANDPEAWRKMNSNKSINADCQTVAVCLKARCAAGYFKRYV